MLLSLLRIWKLQRVAIQVSSLSWETEGVIKASLGEGEVVVDNDVGSSDKSDNKVIGGDNFDEVNVFLNDDVRVNVACSPVVMSIMAATTIKVFYFPHGQLCGISQLLAYFLLFIWICLCIMM